MAMQRVRKAVDPVTHEELEEIAMIWVDAALKLRDRDLRIMDRLVRSQNRIGMQQGLMPGDGAEERQISYARPAFVAH